MIWLVAGAVGIGIAVESLSQNSLADYGLSNALGIFPSAAHRIGLFLVFGVLSVSPVLSTIAVVQRFRRADAEQRQQIKWFGTAVALLAALLVAETFVFATAGIQPYRIPVVNFLTAATLAMLPVSIGIAVLKYRLYDIDVVINKALVYGSLAVFITTVYVAIVVGAGALAGTGGKPNLALSILATAVVAVAFQPIRERVQRFANRLVFGQRANPYEFMADFSEQMAGALSVDDVLPKMAEAAATGVGASHGRVRLFLQDGSQWQAIWPEGLAEGEMDFVVPVSYRGDAIGEIAVAKPTAEPLLPTERKLLTDLAAQAGLVLHNVRLTRELQQRLDEISSQAAAIRASRRRIVAARDTERRRLEQTIHGGTEAQLVSIQAELKRAEQILITDPLSAAALLEQLTGRANDTLETLRDLARGIYPPLLRERGLAAALQAQVRKMQARAQLTMDGLDRYPSEAEAAIYFACVEAIRGATGPAAIDVTATPGSVEFRIRASGLDLDGRQQDIEDRIQALGGCVSLHKGELSGRIPTRMMEPVG